MTPIWIAQFRDVQPQLYWFTTNLWWGMGPAMEIWGLAGIAWLALRRSRVAFIAAAFPVVYFLVAGGTIAPMARYILPLGPGFAVAAGALSAGLLASRSAGGRGPSGPRLSSLELRASTPRRT